LEGRPNSLKYGIKEFIYPGHEKVIFWDNNILGNPNWKALFDEILELGIEVDFNQGLDARLITDEVAERISKAKMSSIRLAYDYIQIGPYVKAALEKLKSHGVYPRKVVVYTLYNYVDDPENFFHRVRDLVNWGAVSYPMRFEPLTSLMKNQYISPHWTADQLQYVAQARRVMGYAGAFPPYKILVDKLNAAQSFQAAFKLREKRTPRKKDRVLKTVEEMSQEILGGSKYHGSRRLKKVNDWRMMLNPQNYSPGK
jgi:hypothetical protein